MKRKNILYIALFTVLLITGIRSFCQDQDNAYIIDRVVAVVGDFNILQSDIEQQYLQLKAGQPYLPDDVRCNIFNYFVQQKLLMNQAKIDSIEVTPEQVDQQLNMRLNSFISQFGSEEAMEEYFNKSMYEIREDLREAMREMIITQQVQQGIIGDIKITPSEVKSFYRNLPTDSIPYIDSEVKFSQIIIYPPVSEDAVFEVKERLLELRKRILDGENFATLAILYSDGPSASNGGEIGFHSRAELDPAYVEAAWSLKEGQVSKIVKTDFGYHIIQVIARQGDRVNTRHILLQPKIDAESKARALSRLDSLRTFIVNDSLTFQTAAKYYSQDKNTAANGGLVVNPQTNAASFKYDELDTKDYYVIRDMKVGEVSQPFETTDKTKKLCYKIIKLNNRTEPHRANLKDDYLLLQNMALVEKQNKVLQEWYEDKRKTTYIRIDDSFKACDEMNNEPSSEK